MASHLSKLNNSSNMPCLRPRNTPTTSTATRAKSNRFTGNLSGLMYFFSHLSHYAAKVPVVTSQIYAKRRGKNSKFRSFQDDPRTLNIEQQDSQDSIADSPREQPTANIEHEHLNTER